MTTTPTEGQDTTAQVLNDLLRAYHTTDAQLHAVRVSSLLARSGPLAAAGITGPDAVRTTTAEATAAATNHVVAYTTLYEFCLGISEDAVEALIEHLRALNNLRRISTTGVIGHMRELSGYDLRSGPATETESRAYFEEAQAALAKLVNLVRESQ